MRLSGSLRVVFVAFLALFMAALSGCSNSGGPAILIVTPVIQPLQILNQPPPPGQANQPYSAVIKALGGLLPYTFTEIGSPIPGLSLTPGGNLQGTPSAAGSYIYQVQVTDSSTPTPRTATASFSIQIATQSGGSSPNAPPKFQSYPTGAQLVHMVNTQYSFAFTAFDPEGDTLTFSLVSVTANGGGGAAGPIAMDSLSGLFTWTPAASNIYTIVVSVSDPTNPPVTFTFLVDVNTSGIGSPPVQPLVFTSSPIVSATEGALYTYQPAPSPGGVTWSILAGPVPPAGNMAINASTGQVTWTPDATHVPGPHTVTIQADNGASANSQQSWNITVASGTLPASAIRVVTSGFTGNNRTRSWERELCRIDPNTPTTPDSVALTGKFFREGSPRFSMTGPKHSLRIGAGVPREVNLNTTGAYIECPQFTAAVPSSLSQTAPASCRLYHCCDTETATNGTGTSDVIFAVDTFGTVQIFSFLTNIHEQIYVPADFSTNPVFVVTSSDGRKMWYCRVDRQTFTAGSTMLEATLTTALAATESVNHQTITRAGSYYWFSARDSVSGNDRLFRCAADAQPAQQPVAENIQIPNGGGTLTVPTKISTYFSRSGNGTKAAFVGGNDMVSGITATTPLTALAGLWRDIWVIDGSTSNLKRVTEYETRRPTAGSNVRLIEVFDEDSAAFKLYSDDFAASPTNDYGGNDNRVMFGYDDNAGNTTHVGHALNYDGSLVGYVLMETNAGNTDGSTDSVRDEVYVAGVNSTNPHDVIRLTSAAAATDTAGSKPPATSRFDPNMGVCTGLAFPMRGGTSGRATRVYFAYGRAGPSGVLLEYGQHLYASDFTVNGAQDIVLASTTDRTTGSPAGATGFDLTTPSTELNMYLGSFEGTGSASSVMTFICLSGTTGAPAAGAQAQLCQLDIYTMNSAVVAGSTGTVQKVKDGSGNALNVYTLDSTRTLYGSSFQGAAPWGQGGNVAVPILSSLFASVPGPATAANIAGLAFAVVTSSTGVENLYQFSTSALGVTAVDLTKLTSPGRINGIDVSVDGFAVAIHRGATLLANPDNRIGTTIQAEQIFVVPNVAASYAANLPPATTPLVATSLGIPATDYTVRSGVWFNSNSLSTSTYEYWFASGQTTINGQGLPESTMVLAKVRCVPLNNPPLVGAPQPVNSATSAGAIALYGAGE